jgi:PAS domain S-box-containing protein
VTSRVLVVEDNRGLAENMAELLGELGAEVRVCANAEDAQRALADRELAEQLDLAIVDMRLPNAASGLDLVPHVQRAAPLCAIIVVTGNASLGSAIEAVRHGVFAYLQKPFDTNGFLSLAERAFAQVALKREREALASELRLSEALHRSVIETVDSLIVGLDGEHRIRMWNPWAAQVTGWTALDVLGLDAYGLLPEDPEAFDRAVTAATRGEVATVELAIRTKHGARRIVRWRMTPLSPSAHSLILAAGTDLTERLELEARAAGAEALAAMGRLTAGLAHEVRNPLNAAKLQLELMSRAARVLPPSKERESLESRTGIVQSELARLARLLDEFLGLARPDHLAIGPIDLGAVIREVIDLEQPVADAAGIELEVDLEDVPLALGDAAKLKQALVNLIVNAIEAIRGDAGGGEKRIRVSAHASGDRVEARIEDTGPGLSRAPHELLEPFVTTKTGGTGLGLSIVKRILELHGGAFDIGPREGGGTVVQLLLRKA